MLVNAADPVAIEPAMARLKAAGIVAVAVDVAAKGAAATVTTNNVEAGEKACQYIVEKLNGKGEVAIMNGPPVSSVIDRVNGCKQAFAKAPGIKVVSDNQNGKGSREGGLEVMIGLLTANDDIDAVFTINDPQAIGADLAAKQLNFTDLIITSVDGAPDIEGALKQEGNLIQASAAQDPFAMAQKAVEVGYEILQGKQPAQTTHPDPGGTDHPRQRRPVQGLDGGEVRRWSGASAPDHASETFPAPAVSSPNGAGAFSSASTSSRRGSNGRRDLHGRAVDRFRSGHDRH